MEVMYWIKRIKKICWAIWTGSCGNCGVGRKADDTAAAGRTAFCAFFLKHQV